MGFFRLERRKQRAGGTVTYGPGLETCLQKNAQLKDKKPEVEFWSEERFLHQWVEKQKKRLPRNIVGETQNSVGYNLERPDLVLKLEAMF